MKSYEAIFAYFTTKADGTGLGLAVVQKLIIRTTWRDDPRRKSAGSWSDIYAFGYRWMLLTEGKMSSLIKYEFWSLAMMTSATARSCRRCCAAGGYQVRGYGSQRPQALRRIHQQVFDGAVRLSIRPSALREMDGITQR